MSEPTHHDSTATTTDSAPASEPAPTANGEALAWLTPDPTLPPGQLTDRELIARAEYCDEIADTGSPADQAGPRAGFAPWPPTTPRAGRERPRRPADPASPDSSVDRRSARGLPRGPGR